MGFKVFYLEKRAFYFWINNRTSDKSVDEKWRNLWEVTKDFPDVLSPDQNFYRCFYSRTKFKSRFLRLVLNAELQDLFSSQWGIHISIWTI